MNKIPTLSDIRRHVAKYGWNASRSPRDYRRHSELFVGMCEYASTALSEILTDTGKCKGRGGDWSMRVRGWYKGEITAYSRCSYGANFHPTEFKHAHSWVVLADGTIVDPTWWQFTNAPAKVYVFPANDPRFEIDSEA